MNLQANKVGHIIYHKWYASYIILFEQVILQAGYVCGQILVARGAFEFGIFILTQNKIISLPGHWTIKTFVGQSETKTWNNEQNGSSG